MMCYINFDPPAGKGMQSSSLNKIVRKDSNKVPILRTNLPGIYWAPTNTGK